MEAWQERVVEEAQELDNKLVKLQQMLALGKPVYIHSVDWSLLHDQHLTMMKYRRILQQRMERFTVTKPG